MEEGGLSQVRQTDAAVVKSGFHLRLTMPNEQEDGSQKLEGGRLRLFAANANLASRAQRPSSGTASLASGIAGFDHGFRRGRAFLERGRSENSRIDGRHFKRRKAEVSGRMTQAREQRTYGG
jgi:hypothetical protein